MNIGYNEIDEYYRYQMPIPIVKHQGAGNGLETYIDNLYEISIAIKRPEIYIIKYLGIKLGSNTRKNKHSDKYILNGRYSKEDILNYIKEFINIFVLCQRCERPETDIIFKKNKLKKICNSCAHLEKIKPTEKTDTIINYIIKHPLIIESTVGI